MGHEQTQDVRRKCGPAIKPEAGKTKISIRLDNRGLDHFRLLVEKAGAGNYQTLINDALVAYIEQRSVIDAVRQVVREKLSGAKKKRISSASSERSSGRQSCRGPVSTVLWPSPASPDTSARVG